MLLTWILPDFVQRSARRTNFFATIHPATVDRHVHRFISRHLCTHANAILRAVTADVFYNERDWTISDVAPKSPMVHPFES